MPAYLKRSIKAKDYNDAMKKAREKLASQSGTSYVVDKVKLTATRNGVKYYRIFVK